MSVVVHATTLEDSLVASEDCGIAFRRGGLEDLGLGLDYG